MNLVEVANEFTTSKNTDLTRFFTIKPTQPGRLKQIWVEKGNNLMLTRMTPVATLCCS